MEVSRRENRVSRGNAYRLSGDGNQPAVEAVFDSKTIRTCSMTDQTYFLIAEGTPPWLNLDNPILEGKGKLYRPAGFW